MAEKVTIHGLRELEANLKILREQFGVRTGGVLIRGLRAGAKIIRDDAKRRVLRVPSGWGPRTVTKGRGKNKRSVATTSASLAAMLRSNIVEHAIPVRSRIADGRPTVLVRVRNRGYRRVNGRIRFNNPGTSPGWWWWQEFGTSKHPAKPFLRPAFESQKMAAIDQFKTTVRAEIDKLFQKNFKIAA